MCKNKLPKLVSYDEIKRGKIFNVAIPFTSERPLDFVIPSFKQSGLYEIVSKDYGFSPQTDLSTGRKYSPTVKIVTDFKLRPAIIVQDDALNTDPNYHFVIVMPISSISQQDRKKDSIKQMIKSNDLDRIHYLDKITGIEAYATISDPKRVHKNMIFKTKNEIIIPTKTMNDMMIKLARCLDVQEISKCNECANDCRRCQYKIVASSNNT